MTEKAYITALQLPFQFDQDQLLKDLDSALTSNWIPHFNLQGYTGDWNSIALYAPEGNPSNIIAMQDEETKLEKTPILDKCPYFQTVLKTFECEFLSVRLLRLGPGAYIKPHRDFELGYEDGCFRLHVPITTHPEVSFVLDGEEIGMSAGSCWYTNVNYVHSVANKGKEDRVHLVIDGKRNEWSDQLFFSLATKEKFFPEKEEKLDPDTLARTIQELKANPQTSQLPLVQELEQKLRAMKKGSRSSSGIFPSQR